MNSVRLGSIIKKIRNERKMSQSELSRNICSRKQLIRIEKGVFYPSTYTLALISKKLGVNLLDYFEFLCYENPILIYDFFITLNKLHKLRDRENILLHLQSDLIRNITLPRHIKMISWYKYISQAYINQEYTVFYDKLIKLLCDYYEIENELITLLHYPIEPEDYKILNSITTLLVHMDEVEKSIKYQEIIIKKWQDYNRLSPPQYIVSCIYNLVKTLYNNKEFNKCLDYCDLGIKYSISSENLLLLGDLYVQKANCYESVGKVDLAKKYYGYYIYYYEILNLENEIAKDKAALNVQYDNMYF